MANNEIAVGTLKGATSGGGATGLAILIEIYSKRHGYDMSSEEALAIAGLLTGPVWFVQEFGLILGLTVLGWMRKLLPAGETVTILPPSTQGP